MSNLLEKASILLTPTAYDDGKILSVKPEDGTGDFTFTRNSSATRVTSQGLIEDMQILSGELVSNSDFSQISSELVTNGDFSNGANNWSLGTGWSIGVGKVIGSSASGTLSQAGIASAGKQYKVTFSVTDYSSGTLYIDIGGSSAQTTTSNGLKTFYFTSTSTGSLRFYGGSFTGSIDNVSVKEVGQDWIVTSSDANNYVEFNGSTARLKFLNTSPITQLKSSFVMTAGKKYKLTVDVLTVTSGGIKIQNAGMTENFNTPGITTRIISPNAATPINFYRATANVDITLNSVSLIEITDDTDLPRIDYSPYSGAGSCGHWLFEPQSTNLITYSEDLSQSSWVKQSAGVALSPVVTASYGISPDGGLNASRVIFNTGGGSSSGDFSQINDPVVVSIGNVTNSVYIKSNTASNYTMSLLNAFGSYTSILVTTEWQRFEVSVAAVSTSSSFRLRLRPTEGTSSVADVLVWGAQVEEQSFATSYIPTSGSTVTRNQESAFGSGNSSLINSTEGVLYAEIAALTQRPNLRRDIALSDGSRANNIVRIHYLTAPVNTIRVQVRSGGTITASVSTTVTDIRDFHKVAISYKVNEVKFYVDGVLIITDTNAAMPIGLNQLSFSDGDGTQNRFFGKTKCLAVFKEALTDDELTCLTTI